MLKLRTLQQIILYKYRAIGGYITLALLAIAFSFWRLTGLARGFSKPELSTIYQNGAWPDWVQTPTAIITHGLQWLVMKIWGLSLFGLRATSVVLGLLAIGLLFISVKHWLGRITAVLSCIIILSSSWWLLQTRQATVSSELLLWLTLICALTWKLYKSSNKMWWLAWCLSLVGLAYMPGGLIITLSIVSIVTIDRKFKKSLQHIATTPKLIIVGLYVLCITPIIVASLNNPGYLRDSLNISSSLSPSYFLNNLANNIVSMFVQLPNVAATEGISGSYVIHYTQSTLLILGFIAVLSKSNLSDNTEQTQFKRLVVVLLIAGLVVSSLSNNYTSTSYTAVPAILIMSAGLWQLKQIWNKRFPLNPYARTVGVMAISTLVIATLLSNYAIYFKIWGMSPTTARAYDSSLVNLRNNLSKIPSDQCSIVFSPKESLEKALVPHSFGLINKQGVCQPLLASTINKSDNKPLLISASAWQKASKADQDFMMQRTHFPITNSLQRNSLQFWVGLPN